MGPRARSLILGEKGFERCYTFFTTVRIGDEKVNIWVCVVISFDRHKVAGFILPFDANAHRRVVINLVNDGFCTGWSTYLLIQMTDCAKNMTQRPFEIARIRIVTAIIVRELFISNRTLAHQSASSTVKICNSSSHRRPAPLVFFLVLDG